MHQEAEQTVRAIAIAGCSGLINYMYLIAKGERQFSVLMMIIQLAISGWVGWFTGVSLDPAFHLGFLPRDAIIGMAGLTSLPVMELISTKGKLIVQILFNGK